MTAFYNMPTIRVLEVLVEGKLDDGTPIDPATQKDSLARVTPMVKEALPKSNEDIWDDKYKHWARLITKAEKIVGRKL